MPRRMSGSPADLPHLGIDTPAWQRAPALPVPRGPLSRAVVDVLRGAAQASDLPAVPAPQDPYCDDLQLALYTCYELHYRGYRGVDESLEWEPELLRFRRELERPFLAELRAGAGSAEPGGMAGPSEVLAELDTLLLEPVDGSGPSPYLLEHGQRWQLREYLAHRSLYQLKEADPHSWVVPRLSGQAKASMVTVQHDEYGAGRGEAVHARLFAEMMEALGLDAGYGRYVDAAPGITMATVNLMSMFGLHRALRGALVGQFAVLEITSPPGADRLLRAVQRFDTSPTATRFYAEHVEADAVHEQLVRRGVVGDLLVTEPELAGDMLLGIRATGALEDRLAGHLLDAWAAGRSSLRKPLPDAPPAPPGPLPRVPRN